MYKLVPPKNKLIEYESPYLKGILFKIKVFDFDEDDKANQILLDNAKRDDKGDLLVDENGNFSIDKDQYYIDIFELGVKEIEGIEGEFTPSWKIIKTVVNKILQINNDVDLEK